ncbi:MAG: DUF1553 domain-containing protein [Planctomycetaceae bacterium]
MKMWAISTPDSIHRSSSGRAIVWLAMAAVVLSNGARAEEPLSYNRDVRPILAEHCFACHGPDSASRKGELRLDQRQAAIDSGAVVPSNPQDSSLVERILSTDAELVMPPPDIKKDLSAEQKAILQKWIVQGAEYEPHWSFIPPSRPEVPTAVDATRAKNPIDHFVMARLQEHSLSLAPEADSRTLFRRLHLDITGLPPAPADIAAFTADYQQRGDAALSDAIDRLMELPAWGEHRARYWLDAARYGDTHGLHFDNYREIWPYRDWVIRSFNANQPFDQFTIEQIAGDLLPEPTTDQLIATGFQRCNITTNEGGTIDEENLALYATDRVQTFGWVYLGLTTNCGQCHDHKFDPFTMRDYYSLAAFFRNTTQPPKDGNVRDGRGPAIVVPSMQDRDRWNALPEEIAAAAKARDARRGAAQPAFDEWLTTATPESLDGDVPATGLVVQLPLNEGSGNEVRNTCNPEQPITATGDVKWNPKGKTGPFCELKTGATFDLGGIGNFELNEGFSYGAWVRPGRDDGSAGIIARMDEATSHRGWDLWQQGNAVAVHIIDLWPDNSMKVVTRDNVLKAGRWNHVFATYDGSGKPQGIRIYVDGQEKPLRTENNTIKKDASIRTETPLRIGQRSQGAVFEGGAVQDVRIYQRQLTGSEVKSIADIVPLRTILASTERTDEQRRLLFDHWLVTRDAEYPALAKVVSDREAERDAIQQRSPVTHIQKERMDQAAMANILIRGEYDRPSDEVKAATPAALHPMPAGAPANRMGLAEWLMAESNPLTARVTVNRFWQQVFGQGIVVTPEDFGVMGALPTHPELLDWLAVDFRESGWDVKRFFKQIFMSSTYRQSAAVTPEKLEKDASNALLSRGPRFRMDAEMVRDLALATSGLLSQQMYGPGVRPYQPGGIWEVVGLPGGDTRNYVQGKGEDLYRRTVYTFWKRMAPPPNLEAFNAPSREVCTVRRERTNTPLQALVTLNDPQFVEAARVLAERSIEATDGSRPNVLNYVFLRVVGRTPSENEQALLLADQETFGTYYAEHPDDAKALIGVGDSPASTKISPDILAAWTMTCNQVLNLDESLNK